MKRFKTYCILFTTLLLLSVVSAHAQSVDLVANVNVTPPLNNGQTFNYSIMSTGSPYNALRIKLNFDPSVVQLNSLTPIYGFDFTPVNDTSTPGVIRYEAASFSGAISTDETIFNIEFQVLDNTQPISIAHDYDAASGTVVVDSGGNDILGTANDILLETLSIEAGYNSATFSIFPNPARDMVSIKYSDSSVPIKSVTIQSLSGKIVLTKKINHSIISDHTINLDISSLPNTLYFLNIVTENGSRTVSKLLVSH